MSSVEEVEVPLHVKAESRVRARVRMVLHRSDIEVSSNAVRSD